MKNYVLRNEKQIRHFHFVDILRNWKNVHIWFFFQGKFYLFVEVTSQLHRQLAPIQVYVGPSKGTDM